jgi:ribose transport system substrate-binding protein
MSVLWTNACHSHKEIRIAVIPRTDGTALWEPEHVGAVAAAHTAGVSIYWNAPTREDDTEAQIALVDRIVSKNYEGLVLAPDQSLSLISPVRRALARGIPTVVVGSPLPIPAGGNLCYILNDDTEGGQLAAQRVAYLLKGHGTVALLGIDPDIASTMTRTQAFELYLAKNYPKIRIVEKQAGSFNALHEQQVAEETLKAHPDLDVVVALIWPSARAVLTALNAEPKERPVKLIGFDPDGDTPFQQSNLDSVILEDTRSMGKLAIEWIHAKQMRRAQPSLVYLHPRLFTEDTIDSPEARAMTMMDWTNGQWHWSVTQ